MTDSHFTMSGASPPQQDRSTRLVYAESSHAVYQPAAAAHLIALGHRRVYTRGSRGFFFERTSALQKDLDYFFALVERLKQEQVRS